MLIRSMGALVFAISHHRGTKTIQVLSTCMQLTEDASDECKSAIGHGTISKESTYQMSSLAQNYSFRPSSPLTFTDSLPPHTSLPPSLQLKPLPTTILHPPPILNIPPRRMMHPNPKNRHANPSLTLLKQPITPRPIRSHPREARKRPPSAIHPRRRNGMLRD